MAWSVRVYSRKYNKKIFKWKKKRDCGSALIIITTKKSCVALNCKQHKKKFYIRENLWKKEHIRRRYHKSIKTCGEHALWNQRNKKRITKMYNLVHKHNKWNAYIYISSKKWKLKFMCILKAEATSKEKNRKESEGSDWMKIDP